VLLCFLAQWKGLSDPYRPGRKVKTRIVLKLRDSELRYRRLFEAAQDGILILDAETGMIEDVNPYLMKMLGYSREEFVEKKLWEVGAFKDIEANKDAFEVLQENEYIRYENLPLKTKDGRLIQVEFVSNVYLAGGEKIIQCDIRDITEHRRIIAALQENEKKYHDLINQSPDGFFIIELSGNILTVNEATCKELEFSEEELLSMNIWDIIPEPYLDQYKERLMKVLRGESLKEATEYVVRGKGGKNHYVEVISAPRYSGRDIIGFQGIARDITARKQAEEALQESEAKFRMLVAHLPTVVYVNAIGDASSTLYVSPQIEPLLGYTSQEWMADPKLWLKTLHPEDSQHVLKQVAHTDETNKPFEMEYRMIARDGRLVWVHDQVILVNDSDGQPQFWQGIMLDITERKQGEEALRESESALQGILRSTADGILAVNKENKTLFANERFIEMWRIPQAVLATQDDTVILQHVLDQLSDPQAFLKKVQELYKSDEESFDTLYFKDGRVFERLSRPLLRATELRGRVWSFRDISARTQAEQALQKEKDRAQQYLDIAGVIFLVLAADRKVTLINKEGCEILGYFEEEMVGQDFFDHFLPQDEKDKFGSEFDRIMAGKMELMEYFESPILTKSGQERLIAWHNSALVDEAGRIIGVVSSGEDITKRKQSEEKIQQQLEHLTALRTIDRVIAANFDLKLSLSEILTHVTKELNIDAAAILILNSNSQMLEYGSERGFRTTAVRKVPVRLGASYAGRVVLKRQSVQIQNPKGEQPENLFLGTPLAGEDFVFYYGVPLITKGQVKGVLEVLQRVALEPDTEWYDFLHNLASQAAIAIENAMLFESLQRSNSELTLAYDATIEGWSRALDLRDKETEGHTQRVTEMTEKLARTFGLSEAELMHIRWGALLHDIGKMGVPDGILLKPGALTDEEWVVMKKHPAFAYEMLSPIRYLQQSLDIPYCHHEKWDGTGYPRGLKGAQTPLSARIFAVVDVWDALCSDRPYRAGWLEEKVREHIRALSGTHFDPQVVDIFMQSLD
jgi:PAS domain S-box-containing protein/putative nucleotidyltransferase with HDIG domain